MASTEIGVAYFTYALIYKKVFIMLSSSMVQVFQSATINRNGINKMIDVGRQVLQYQAAMWFSVRDMHVNVRINHERR